MGKRLTGTFEWAKHTDNCLRGCSHACRYCYARYNDVERFKRATDAEWERPQLSADWDKPRHKLSDGVMFPTTHDILPRFIDPCMSVIEQHLQVGNKLLIVSKPHLFCIEEILQMVPHRRHYRDLIVFRFTIGSVNDAVLSFWEPGAPCFAERLACLKRAHEEGFETSVSAEPLLGGATLRPTPNAVSRLVGILTPYVTHSIWIGMMNRAGQRVRCDTPDEHEMLAVQLQGQELTTVKQIYDALKGNPLIRWKDSYCKALGLKQAAAPEMTDGS